MIDTINPLFEPSEFPPLAGRKCVSRWDVKSMFHGLYEVPADTIRHLLPKGVELFEPRPGVAIYDIGHVHWNEGNLRGAWPEFHELTIMVLVQPDLSIEMPVPKFCFFVLRIASDLQAFVDNEARVLHLPTAYVPVICDKTTDPIGVKISDGQAVMFDFRDTHRNPVYRQDDFYGQYYAVQDGKLWFGLWRWEGLIFEHQKNGDGGSLQNHQLLYGDLNVEQDCTELFMQMYTKPGTHCIETFYEPWVLRDV